MTQNDTLHKVSDRPLSDMLVNLLDGSFEPKVHCDSVSTEGYSVNNLVSCNTRERCRGFLSAHFIRPPIVVLFQLPFPASVELLVIGPKVGSQMSTGIDIFFARTSWNVHEGSGFSQSGREGHRSSKGPKSKRRKMNEITRQLPATKCEGSDATVTVQKPLLHQYTDEITAASFKAEHANLFSQVARLSAQDGRTIGVIDPRSHEGKNKIPTGSTQERFRQCHLLRCITHLALRVHRVNSSGAVAIGKVELWGKPAPICGEEIVEYTHKIYRSLNQETSQCHLNSPIRGQNQHTIRHGRDEAGLKTVDRRVVQAVGTQQSSLGTKSATSDIPEEFMDAITCDIMTIPMLLPSGHNVDSSTLDKHCAVEETWGRVPSDPFTGIPFSEMHKAVPNSALKVRIDKFLLSSGLNVQGRGRTVGRGTRAVGKTQLVACAGEGTMTKCSNETAKQSWCSTGNTDSSLSESTESSAAKYQSNPVAEGEMPEPYLSRSWKHGHLIITHGTGVQKNRTLWEIKIRV